MTADSSQSEYIMKKRTELCAVWGHTHPFSDLFSPLSSSRSSGENVILHLNEEKKMRLERLQAFVLHGSQNGFTVTADVKLCKICGRVPCGSPCTEGKEKGQLRKQKSDGKNNQMSQ